MNIDDSLSTSRGIISRLVGRNQNAQIPMIFSYYKPATSIYRASTRGRYAGISFVSRAGLEPEEGLDNI